MEKKTLLAVVLSIAVLFIWTWLFTPPPAPPPAASGAAATPAPAASPPAAEASAGSPDLSGLGTPDAAAARPDLPAGRRIAAEAEETIVIDTPLQEIHLSNRGARAVSWRLKKYLDDKGQPLQIVSPAGRQLDHLPLQFLLDDLEAARLLKEALYRVTRREVKDGDGAATEVRFEWSDGEGLQATKTIRVAGASYVSDLDVAAAIDGKPVAPTLVWGAGFGSHNGLENGRYEDTVQMVLNIGGRVTRVPQAKVKAGTSVSEAGPILWAGLEDRYFAALLVPAEPAAAPAEGRARLESLRLVEEGREHFVPAFAFGVAGRSHFHLFVGPKDYDLLKTFGLGLETLVDFGRFLGLPLAVIALPLFYALKFTHRWVGNYGWSIVIVTFVVRLIFFPLMHKSQVNMRRMQEKMKRVQPKMKALRERYHRLERKEIEKGNPRERQRLRQEMNEKLMELYHEEGINPMASMTGCLPLLLQLPILYAFYVILTIAIELRKAPFLLWIHDLSRKDPYFVTPIVMGASMLLQQAMTSSSIADPAQRRIMYIMPVMFTYFFINLPSGLVLYWLTSNLLGILQQYLINREVEAEGRAA